MLLITALHSLSTKREAFFWRGVGSFHHYHSSAEYINMSRQNIFLPVQLHGSRLSPLPTGKVDILQ